MVFLTIVVCSYLQFPSGSNLLSCVSFQYGCFLEFNVRILLVIMAKWNDLHCKSCICHFKCLYLHLYCYTSGGIVRSQSLFSRIACAACLLWFNFYLRCCISSWTGALSFSLKSTYSLNMPSFSTSLTCFKFERLIFNMGQLSTLIA